jgi:branched-chain amino acid transport system ATP-binding protein
MSEPILAVESLETCYGLSQVLFGISLAIAPGEMVTLMGRNGMGKTTTVRSIMGLTPARAGRVRFSGADIRGLPAYRIAQFGIGLAKTSSPLPVAPANGRLRASTICSHASPNARAAWAISSPAASNRCSPSAAR